MFMTSGVPISVVIPLYNKADYVAGAIESVLAQTWPDFELIVVDDGSTDKSAECVMHFTHDPRVRLIRQRNRGVGAARNLGMSKASGGLIAFLDADDEWLQSHLQKISTLAQRFPNAGILATGFRAIKASLNRHCFEKPEIECADSLLVDVGHFFRLSTSYLKRESLRPTLCCRCGLKPYPHTACLHISACAVRRNVYATLGGFVEAMPLGEDQEYCARVCLHYPLAYNPELTCLYRVGVPQSALSHRAPEGWYPPAVRTIKEYLAGRGGGRDCAQSMRDYAGSILLNHIADLLECGKKLEAMRLFRDDILENCAWRTRILRLRVGSHLPPPLIRAYVGARRRMARQIAGLQLPART
jgi:GT2 family glycosyltransferase